MSMIQDCFAHFICLFSQTFKLKADCGLHISYIVQMDIYCVLTSKIGAIMAADI